MGVNQNRRPRPSVPIHTKRRRQTKKLTRPYTVSKQPVVTAPLAGMATWVRLCCKHSDGSLWNNGIFVNRHMRQTRHHQQPRSRARNRLVVPLATTKTRQARRPQSVTRIHKQTFAKRRHTRHRTSDRLRAITQLALRSWHMANRQIPVRRLVACRGEQPASKRP
jgi:hypothetical protein